MSGPHVYYVGNLTYISVREYINVIVLGYINGSLGR